MCHERNVPHTPRNNKTWRKEELILQQNCILGVLEIFYCNPRAIHDYRCVVGVVGEHIGELNGKIRQHMSNVVKDATLSEYFVFCLFI